MATHNNWLSKRHAQYDADAKKAPRKTAYLPGDEMRPSLEWARHWRKSIWKIVVLDFVIEGQRVYRVFPRNPDWEEWARHESIDLLAPAPPMHLDPVDFESIEELDTWARVIARLDQ